MKKNKKLMIIMILCLGLLLGSCGGSDGDGNPASGPASPAASSPQSTAETGTGDGFKIAVMSPGVIGENPTFQQLIAGVEQACDELGLEAPNVVEGGEDWEAYGRMLASLADTGEYDVILTYTDYMCDNIKTCSETYPDQKFILLDGDLTAYMDAIPDNVYAMRYREEDLGYMGGYFCALVTQSDMERANDDLKVGLIFTDEYDPWEERIKPCFINAVKTVNPDIKVVNSIVGDWVDPNKGAEVARAQFAEGVDIVWYTSSASTYGVVTEAAAQERYVVANDDSDFEMDPDTIVGGTVIKAQNLAYQVAKSAALEELAYGSFEVGGVAQGVISFTFDNPVYLEKVPQDIRDAMQEMYDKLAAGEIDPYDTSY